MVLQQPTAATSTPTATSRVLALVPPARTSSVLWRQLWPIATLNARGHPVGTAIADPARTDWLAAAAGCDVLVLPRFHVPTAVLPGVAAYFEALRRQGTVIVGDYDDHLWLPDEEAGRWFWATTATPFGLVPTRRPGPGEVAPLAERLASLRLLDAVTVNTPATANVVRGLTDAPVAVVPSLLDVSWFRAVKDAIPRLVPPLTIGFAGAIRNASDLAALAEAWGRVAARCPAVTFVTFTDPAPVLVGAVPRDRHIHIPRTELDRYPVGYASIDIGCAAVDTHPASLCRSPNKVVEYGAAGAAVVASHALYGDLIRDGENGLLATTADEWEDALARLVADAALRARLAGALTAVVDRDWALDRHAPRWLAAWADLRAAVLVGEGR